MQHPLALIVGALLAIEGALVVSAFVVFTRCHPADPVIRNISVATFNIALATTNIAVLIVLKVAGALGWF